MGETTLKPSDECLDCECRREEHPIHFANETCRGRYTGAALSQGPAGPTFHPPRLNAARLEVIANTLERLADRLVFTLPDGARDNMRRDAAHLRELIEHFAPLQQSLGPSPAPRSERQT